MAMTNADITDQVDGAISTFIVPGNEAATSEVFIVFQNGQRIHESEVSKVDSKTFTLSFTPEVGQNLEVQYNDILTDEDIAGT